MQQRIYFFLVVFLLIFNGVGMGQGKGRFFNRLSSDNKGITNLHPRPLLILFRETSAPGFNNWELKKKITNLIVFGKEQPVFNMSCFGGVEVFPTTQNSSFLRVPPVLSPSFYNDRLGFVCKKEWQLEKATMIPLRVRLGSLDYVNWLEQKPNAVRH